MRYLKNLRFNRSHGFDVNREITVSEKSFVSLNREIDGTEHNYNLFVDPSLKGGYRLSVYLAMTSHNSEDILVYTRNYATRKDAEKDACRVINELERSDLSEYIEEWKECSVTPVFDEKCNHLGDAYTSILLLRNNAKSFDYYNTNPITKYFGKFYILNRKNDKNFYEEETIDLGTSVSKSDDNPEVLNKLLSKLNKEKYARFFE